MVKKDDSGMARFIVALVGLVLFAGTIWATMSSEMSALKACQDGQRELWAAQYMSLREDIQRLEMKVDRLLERDRVAAIGVDKHGDE